MPLRALARVACVTALAVVAMIASAAPARAGAAEDAQTKIAKKHFYAGEKLFALGRFSDALAEYEAAFDAKPLPAFLFNIGQCHRNLHDYDAAIFSYRKYLSLLPDAPNRAEVEDLVRELEDAQAREKAVDDQRETDRARAATSAGPDDRPLYTKWWLWTGVGVVAAGTATFFLTRDRGVPSTDLGNVAFPK
jgi:tetratricopeptide (TPR) repeat protein